MDGVVFGGRDGLEIFRVVALHGLDEGHGHAAGEVGVLAIGLHAAAPAGVAEEVDVGRPEGEALVDVVFAAADEFVIFGAGLIGNGCGDAGHEVGVPGSGDADGLGEHGGAAGAGDAVKRFVPPVIGGNAEPLDGGRIVHELGNFFFEGHAREEVVDALFDGGVGIFIEHLGVEGGERGGYA